MSNQIYVLLQSRVNQNIALVVRSDTLKGIVRHNLPQQYKCSRK